MAWQTVDVSIEVDVADDAPDDLGEQVVKDALLADERIAYVEISRVSPLIER